MFRITEDPSSGSLVQCLAKVTRMVLSCPSTWTRSVLWQHTPVVDLCTAQYKFNYIYELYICAFVGQESVCY